MLLLLLAQMRMRMLYAVPLGSLGAPCIYGSQCSTVNAQCTAGFCRCLLGYFYKQRGCGEQTATNLAAACHLCRRRKTVEDERRDLRSKSTRAQLSQTKDVYMPNVVWFTDIFDLEVCNRIRYSTIRYGRLTCAQKLMTWPA